MSSICKCLMVILYYTKLSLENHQQNAKRQLLFYSSFSLSLIHLNWSRITKILLRLRFFNSSSNLLSSITFFRFILTLLIYCITYLSSFSLSKISFLCSSLATTVFSYLHFFFHIRNVYHNKLFFLY